jgi:hypothetical protein
MDVLTQVTKCNLPPVPTQSLYTILKIVGVGVAIMAGLAAVMQDALKDKDKPRSRSSIALTGLIIAFLIGGSLLSYYVDRLKDKQDDAYQSALFACLQMQISEQENQLQVGRDLAEKLTTAQETTTRISSELTRNTRTVGNVLEQTERALEPLGEFRFICTLRVPDTDEETANIVQFLKPGQRGDQTSEADPGEKRRSVLLPMPIVAGTYLPRDSSLFPKPNTALGALLESVQVLLQFYAKALPPSAYAQGKPPEPDLMTEIVPTPQLKWLMLTAPDHRFVMQIMGSVLPGEWGSTGTILSVKDLLRAQVVVQPLFSFPRDMDDHQRRLALEKWAGISLDSLTMYTGDGRRWVLDIKKLEIVRPQGSPLFVGRFKGPIKPNTITP